MKEEVRYRLNPAVRWRVDLTVEEYRFLLKLAKGDWDTREFHIAREITERSTPFVPQDAHQG